MLSLRVSRATDIDAIATIHAHCWKEVYSFMPQEVLDNRDYRFRLQQWQNWFAEKKYEQNEGLFVMEAGHKVVGFCMCKPNTDPDIPQALGELHAQYMWPQYRASGTGYQVLQVLTAYLLAKKMTPMCCWAFAENEIWHWYERMGFEKVVSRNRVINGMELPEYGFIHNDPEGLMYRLTLRSIKSTTFVTSSVSSSVWFAWAAVLFAVSFIVSKISMKVSANVSGSFASFSRLHRK
ncbi:GNAT family N-acetyltransferase [Terasakiella sp. SH-1]|uniref:GNAT family N-acetyltransferase n=1 Tax=Terasakiella sp. SH-1 TaxID=2560057 RepID=UPI001073268F|nr:GNAT family N-acetyltransferase [Terasakiella sp. SH-1]